MIGDHFVNKCLNSTTMNDPWPHQYIEDTLPQDDFLKLQEQCRNINVPKDKLVAIHPYDFADQKSFHTVLPDKDPDPSDSEKGLVSEAPFPFVSPDRLSGIPQLHDRIDPLSPGIGLLSKDPAFPHSYL